MAWGRGIARDIKERLMENIVIDEKTNCWLWQGALDKDGYGKILYKGSRWRVHRLSYYIYSGLIFDQILHRIECPNKHCINPEHLKDGNHLENMNDRDMLGHNFNANKTHCPKNHALSGDNLHITIEGHRKCKTCHREQENLRNDMKRKGLLL